MSHYRLELDPGPVEQAARRLDRAGEALDAASRKAQRTAAGWAAGWRGASATAATAEVQGLTGLLSRGAKALQAAAAALTRLAEDYRQALEAELPALDRRRERVQDARAAARGAAQHAFEVTLSGVTSLERVDALPSATAARTRQLASAAATEAAELRAVDAAYDALVDRLRARTRATGSALAADPPVSVPPLAMVTYAQPGPLGSLTGGMLDAAGALAGVLALGSLSVRLQDPPGDAAGLAALLEQARAVGLPATAYQKVLREHWLAKALQAACISPQDWDPSLGAQANRANIEKVYAYYASLYLQDPDLQWSGMAAMIGPSFAAGFLDLAMLRRLSDEVPERLRPALPPGVPELGDLTAAEIRYYETALLTMQQQIFHDQGVQHQAYADGGMAAIEELAAANLVSPTSLRAWQDIASGDPARVSEGNGYHLYREQYEIIGEPYDQMRERFPTGPVVTWAMTFAGSPSIPGARSYPDVFPITLEQGTPGLRRVPFLGWDNPLQVTARVTTPFPDGNISVRDERWALIEQDTLPAYQALIKDDPQQVRALLEQPVAERIEQYRLANRWPELAAQLVDWDVEVRQ